MANTEKITVGLIRGRHNLPVDKYIFDNELSLPLDYQEIDKTIGSFISNEVGITTAYGMGIDREPDYGELVYDLVRVGSKELIVYVTGLTPVTASLIKICAKNGVSLTLMHYNPLSKEYLPQIIFN